MTSLETTPTRNILIAVDVQNDFINGSLAVPEGEQVIAPLNSLAAAVRETDGTVIYTRDWHPEKTPHFDIWPVHCVERTSGAQFDERLDLRKRDVIISKGQGQEHGYSATEGATDTGRTLQEIIRPSEHESHVRVFIGGLATDYCVLNTTLDTARLFTHEPRVSLFLVRDAIRAVNIHSDDGDKAIEAMQQAGVTALTSDEIRRRFF